MPWKENTVMDERIGFIKEYNSGLFAMTELCQRYEISRKTGHKWQERYRDFGAAGLMDRPRRPHEHGRATPRNIAEAIISTVFASGLGAAQDHRETLSGPS
ncbi:MAG: helix-turn-helix domain-containing protein [Beijerinckiaceae bacterium]